MNRLAILLLILFSVKAYAQDQSLETKYHYKIEITGGLAFFNEKDPKEINSNKTKLLPFTPKTINDFPSQLYYGVAILVPLGSGFSIGPSYQFLTTGSRIGLKDYSATYTFDQVISANSIGLQTEYLLNKFNKIEFSIENTAGIHIAKWELIEKIKMGEEENNYTDQLTAIKPFVFPGIKLAYPASQNLVLAFKAGYSFDLLGKYKLENDPQRKSTMNASFTGPRVSLTAEFRL